MDEKENVLLENIKEFYKNGIFLEKKKEFNTSVTLFFKSLAILGDLLISRKKGFIPTSHGERFKIFKLDYPELYDLFDRDFSFYQQSYSFKLNSEASSLLRKDVEKLFEILKINF